MIQQAVKTRVPQQVKKRIAERRSGHDLQFHRLLDWCGVLQREAATPGDVVRGGC